jgi:hypothetical protein
VLQVLAWGTFILRYRGSCAGSPLAFGWLACAAILFDALSLLLLLLLSLLLSLTAACA